MNFNFYAPRDRSTGMTREEAIAKTATLWWENKSAEEILRFQLFEDRLCMPFYLFRRFLELFFCRIILIENLGPQDVEKLRSEFNKKYFAVGDSWVFDKTREE